MRRLQTIALLTAAGALLALPAIGEAHKTGAQHNHGKANGKANGNGKGKSCANKSTVWKGFVVKGTLKTYTAATGANPATVVITVTGANRHARNSGELDDTNTSQPGTQVAGGEYTVDDDVAGFTVQADTPSTGDKVRVIGKVEVTRKKCAAANATLDDRYGDVNVRKVKIIDAD